VRTNVAETSREAYDHLKSKGTLTTRQKQVIAAMREDRDYSLQELVRLTKLPINVVSGRVSELKNPPLGRLEHGPKRKCTVTQNTVQPVKLARMQNNLFDL
jgi:predicted transcriptional regulator